MSQLAAYIRSVIADNNIDNDLNLLDRYQIRTFEDIQRCSSDRWNQLRGQITIPAIANLLIPIRSMNSGNFLFRFILLTKLDEGESFEQVEKIETRIANILKNEYIDGSQLKECIQNADDAGATKVKFMLDERKFTNSFNELGLSEQSQPSFCIFNNGVFSDVDWKNILSLANSEKKKDLTTTGQFGLGFNSLYHVTDTPIIVSGKYVAFLDPLNKYSESTFFL